MQVPPMPPVDAAEWTIERREPHAAGVGNEHPFEFIDYRRNKSD